LRGSTSQAYGGGKIWLLYKINEIKLDKVKIKWYNKIDKKGGNYAN